MEKNQGVVYEKGAPASRRSLSVYLTSILLTDNNTAAAKGLLVFQTYRVTQKVLDNLLTIKANRSCSAAKSDAVSVTYAHVIGLCIHKKLIIDTEGYRLPI